MFLIHFKSCFNSSPHPDQAFLVADGFIVSFDGRVLKIPRSCDLVLAAAVTKNTFAITLKSDWTEKQHSLMVQLQNTTVMVSSKEQVCAQLTIVFMTKYWFYSFHYFVNKMTCTFYTGIRENHFLVVNLNHVSKVGHCDPPEQLQCTMV